MHFKMLSAICFNLEQSKILSSGNKLRGLIIIIVTGFIFLTMVMWVAASDLIKMLCQKETSEKLGSCTGHLDIGEICVILKMALITIE